MTHIEDRKSDSGQNEIEFHLIDLVPGDGCRTERVDLETKLHLLEQSLNSWLREKTLAMESEWLSASVAGTSADLPGGVRRGRHLEKRAPHYRPGGGDSCEYG